VYATEKAFRDNVLKHVGKPQPSDDFKDYAESMILNSGRQLRMPIFMVLLMLAYLKRAAPTVLHDKDPYKLLLFGAHAVTHKVCSICALEDYKCFESVLRRWLVVGGIKLDGMLELPRGI
jgi:hypothetical protein